MVSDSIANASIPSAAFNSKDLGKKKRARSAKLKQYKLDVRREQWLSQGTVKNNGGVGVAGMGNKENNHPLGNVETRPRGKERTNIGGGGSTTTNHQNQHQNQNNDSDSESLSNTPTSPASSVLGGNDSGTNFTGSSSSSTTSSSTSGDCCSGSISEEDDDGCLDDWEAVADALAAEEEEEGEKHEEIRQFSESPPEHDPILPPPKNSNSKQGSSSGRNVPRGGSASNGRAWRPDDAYRPQSLPNLSKQLSLPISDREQQNQQQHDHFGCGGVVPWALVNVMPPPTSCPICTEDLDLTDSSFLPCLCGFRLCLFCYKRIIEDDGRCPGCRKPYEQNPVQAPTVRLARSFSMITRS